MVRMTVTQFARNLREALDRIEHRREGVELVRNNHPIARIIPGPYAQTALEALGDLYRTLPDSAGAQWAAESRVPGLLHDEVRDPWDS